MKIKDKTIFVNFDLEIVKFYIKLLLLIRDNLSWLFLLSLKKSVQGITRVLI